ncbi:DUF4062 domain-containing protein [Streptomyces sp. DSM 40484]|uniref:DUF4062 domain-containing protein n=1 Tax=Streptomyces kroppenstedtii TaxID=3051181 RepID=UPI0028D2B86C|nr:DUF4062 domain-containing protein [Streptomyces sp. DSM 40484]
MKIFISSVRKGLEEERDCLPSLITALGHIPVRFEDFSAQTTPSREACLKALGSADLCIFLLGPKYGHVFPETGQSATHDEWMAAQAAGKTRLVYRKQGVTLEPEQHAFTRTVEAYATGVFRDAFGNTAELQTKIVQKVKELEEGPSPLTYSRLAHPTDLRWDLDDNTSHPGITNRGPRLALHVLPLDFTGHSARELQQLGASLADRIRRTGILRNDVALTSSGSQEHVTVNIPASRPRTWNTPQPGELVEVRLHKTGQVCAYATLPRDGLGSILDAEELPRQLAGLLKFTGALSVVQQDRVVVAAAVSEVAQTSIDTFRPHQSRTSASMGGLGRSPSMLRTEPDEAVSVAALGSGAEEVSSHLARALITQHPSAS